jgi:hypothetical protein
VTVVSAGRKRSLRIGLVACAALLIVGVVFWATSRGGGDPGQAIGAHHHSTLTRKKATKVPKPSVPKPSVPVAPAAPSPFAETTPYLATRSDTVTAAVYNVTTGQLFTLHPGIRQAEASIVKVDILSTYLWEGMKDPGTIAPGEQSVIESMIEDSDNDSATSLWDQVGAPSSIASFNSTIGMTSTTPSACVVCPDFPWPGWGLTTTTAEDQVDLLRQLVLPNSVFTTSQRQYALKLMESIEPSEAWGITSGVPAGVTVALKNGWLPLSGNEDWQVNSIGWVDGAGSDYIIAVLTTGNSTEQYGIDTIQTLSADVWTSLQP